jgi:hypothetical protein
LLQASSCKSLFVDAQTHANHQHRDKEAQTASKGETTGGKNEA